MAAEVNDGMLPLSTNEAATGVSMNAPTDAATEASTPRNGVGSLLRARRLELGMSHADVAGFVKLPARRIAALEEERWDELPDGPYLRGFLRNVARALQIDESTFLERVDASRMRLRNPESILVAPGVTHATMPRRSGRLDDRRNSRNWVGGALVFALIAALIAWSGTESFDRALAGGRALIAGKAGTAPTTPEPVAHDATAATPPGPIESGAVASAPVPAEAAATGAPAIAPADAPSAVAATAAGMPPAPAGGDALVFRFTQDSWVEVKGADGKVLLQRLNPAGSEQQVAGNGPFSLIVGNAKGVELRFRGQPVDLGPHTRDAVARFTLP